MTRTCGYCRSSINDGDMFCQTCGRQAPPAALGYPADGRVAAAPEPAVAAVPGPDRGSSWGPSAAGLPSPAMAPAAGAATGAGEVNGTYVGHRLAYETKLEPSFDPLFNVRFLAQLALRGLLYWWVWLISLLPIGIISGILAAISVGFGLTVFIILILGVTGVLLGCYWFLKIPIKLSEWKYSVDGKAAAAPMVLDHIASVLRGRATPLNSLTVCRLQPPGGEAAKDYLELRSTIFYGYVACFPYGTDLYLGWTFWVRISPFWYLCMYIMRIWESVRNRGNDLYHSLRFDTARAMRETMHSATREGADVAVGRLAGQGRGTIGSVVPVVESAV
jgi:hypothetical protein